MIEFLSQASWTINWNAVLIFMRGHLNIEGNGELLARAIGNLISNAIKYGADGKLVEVHTGLKD